MEEEREPARVMPLGRNIDAELIELARCAVARTRLTRLTCDDSRITREGLQAIAALSNLRELSLANAALCRDAIRVLITVPLRRLSLARTPLGDGELRALAELTTLEELDISSTRVTDVGLVELHRFVSLRKLDLSSNRISGNTVNWAGLSLQALSLAHCSINDRVVPSICRMRDLQRLDLSDAEITTCGAEFLAQVSDLQILNLSSTQIDDAALRSLALLKHLTDLNLADTRVTDAGVAAISSLGSLRSLDLWGTAITDAAVKHLTRLRRLRCLNLSQTRITGACVASFARLPELQSLDVRGTRVGEKGLEWLQRLRPGCQVFL